MDVPSLESLTPSLRERRFAWYVAALLITITAVGVLIHVRTPQVRSVLVVIVAILVVTETLSAFVFFTQFVETRHLPLFFAGCAYGLTSALIVPYVLTFPNLFAHGYLFGASEQSAIVLWALWHGAFPLLICASAFSELSPPFSRSPRVLVGAVVVALAGVAICAGVLASHFAVRLPLLVIGNEHFTALTTVVVLPAIVTLDLLAMAALVFFTGLRTQMQLWLTIALFASALDAILGVTSDRYTLAWYVGKVLSLVSSTLLFAVYLRTISLLYGTLRSMYYTLERIREREAVDAAEQREVVERALIDARRGMPLGTWQFEPQSGRCFWSRAMYELLRVPASTEASWEVYVAHMHPEDRATHAEPMRSAFARPESFEFVHRLDVDGGERWIELRGDCANAPERGLQWFGTLADVSERVEAEKRVAEIAFLDPATQLPNRAALRNALSEFVGRGTAIAFLFVDLDRFKVINEVYGHPTGDAYLRALGGRLRDALPESYVARFGGDEYAIVLCDDVSDDQISQVARRILRIVSQPVLLSGREYHTTASIGISVFPNHAKTVDEVVSNADVAMYRAKANGGNGWCLFSRAMRESQVERLGLESDIRQALAFDAFTLHYQPYLDLRTNVVSGAEALLRWTHPTRGAVSPSTVVEVAESAGLMGRIGEWVLDSGIAQRSMWRSAYPNLRISLNVSVGQLQNEQFEHRLAASLYRHRVEAHEVELEITESVAMEGATVEEQIRRCREHGVSFALDDFGTHYSSLTYLQRLPVEKIKIDRSFVKDLPANAKDAAIARAVIELAHTLGRVVVAEGVETLAQLDWLREAGCDIAQGYFVGKPMAPRDFEQWMLHQHGIAAS